MGIFRGGVLFRNGFDGDGIAFDGNFLKTPAATVLFTECLPLIEAVAMEWEGQKIEIQRYKGLGEMNANQLWETTMNRENSTLFQVTISDAVEANLIFSRLMGEDVESRREFIVSKAKFVTNLDI